MVCPVSQSKSGTEPIKIVIEREINLFANPKKPLTPSIQPLRNVYTTPL